MPLSCCSASHAGVRRQNNEDSCCVRQDLGLFVVADGVGGYAAGEIASRAAVEAVQQAVIETVGRTKESEWPFDYQPPLGVDGNRLNWAFHLANHRLRAETEAGRGRRGMATTVAALLLESDANGVREPVRGATIGHVGDSRIYRFRDGKLARLTRDHSWVQEQVRAGLISDDEARAHPRRNLLTRALTGAADPIADLGWVPVAAGDRLLLCSDGLCSVLTDEQIAEILMQDAVPAGDQEAGPSASASPTGGPRPPGKSGDRGRRDSRDPRDGIDGVLGEKTIAITQAAADSVCDALVHAANLAGGHDNITVILVRV